MNALGSTQTVVVCVGGGSAWGSAPCPPGQTVSVVQAYLITPSEAAKFNMNAEPFDSATAGAFFGFAFASTVFVWLLSLGAGAVIKMVRSA
jgi:hypothetical protein